jgi:oligopeptide transport system ATP-binding protein
MGEALLEVRGLQKHFPLTQGIVFKRTIGHVRAVDGVDLTLRRGETVGLVGESGCGKSTVSKLIVALEKPTAGSIFFKGRDVARMGGRALKDYRREVQIIFQDPYASLNPRMTVGEILAEPLMLHDIVPARQRRARVEELLAMVGLRPQLAARYRTNSRAGSASASWSPGPSRSSRRSSSATRPFRPSTCRSGRRS